jgi:hypothetical protein
MQFSDNWLASHDVTKMLGEKYGRDFLIWIMGLAKLAYFFRVCDKAFSNLQLDRNLENFLTVSMADV